MMDITKYKNASLYFVRKAVIAIVQMEAQTAIADRRNNVK